MYKIPPPIRVAIADDHHLVRIGLKTAIDTQEDLCFVAEASSGVAAIALAKRHPLDILLIDIQMPDMNGLKVAEQLRQQQPSIKIILLSSLCDSFLVEKFLTLELAGYLLKDEPPRRVMQSIRDVYHGEPALSTAVQKIILQRRKGVQSELSEREREVLKLAAHGWCNQRIANRLIITPGTVKNHMNNIYSKLPGVGNRSEAVVWAWENRVVSLAPY
ncbi:MAG: response regulator [Candidatus Promineifilaceae bacterium]